MKNRRGRRRRPNLPGRIGPVPAAGLLTILVLTLGTTPAFRPTRASAQPGGAAPPAARPAPIDLDAVPDVDTTRHSVDLKDVVFDTFNGSFVRLSRAPTGLIRALRDAIRPIYRPVYGGADGLPWLRDADWVIAYVSKGVAYAYPLKVLNFRELVNDVIDGAPILVSYCPLCGSGAVYSRVMEGRTLRFGNTSALYESDMVMYDHETGSYWFQVLGTAIVGKMTGKRLTPLPSATVRWGEWKRLHPGTRLLVGDGNGRFGRRYVRDPFAGYAESVSNGRFVFPVSRDRLDGRLRAGEVVITAEVGSTVKAYPVRLIGEAAVNDRVAGRPVVIFSRGTAGSAFLATVEGRRLTFRFRDGRFVDQETESAWSLAGQAVSGPLKGKGLE
ncbi:MAG: DUF3179 domain-containing (seleno)protein, partial [Nitrospinota bacterium]